MHTFIINLLPLIYRSLYLPGRAVSKINSILNIDLNNIKLPKIVNCRYKLKINIINIHDLIQNQIYFQGYFEHKETKILKKNLRPGMTVLDIGANIGWHSMLSARFVGNGGNVFSFEPVTATYQQLVQNIQINNFKNVKSFQCGLSNKNELIKIYAIDKDNDGSNSIFPNSEKSLPIELVQIRRGDEILNYEKIQLIDFCKIDIEGAEIDALEGLGIYISKNLIKKILIELNEAALKKAGRSGAELYDFLANAGYRIFEVKTGRQLQSKERLPAQANLLCISKY